MLRYLHVKNLALIDEIEVEFKEGLNILTGETGAGKSIVIGSILLALGGRYRGDSLRAGARAGLVELIFTVKNKTLLDRLASLDIFPEEGQFILSRKLLEGHSICRVNGESVSASLLKETADLLINVYGQRDSATLLYKKNHLSLLDSYAKETVGSLKETVRSFYEKYKRAERLLAESTMNDQSLQREISLSQYEINEIEQAALAEAEDEKLEEKYRRMNESKKVKASIAAAYDCTAKSPSGNASDLLSRAIRAFFDVSECDEKGEALYNELVEVDNLLNDFNRALSTYGETFEFSEQEYDETENRLNLINRLKAKYGNSVAEINEYARKRRERLKTLLDHKNYIAGLTNEVKKAEDNLKKASETLSLARKEACVPFAQEIKKALADLNFPYVKFEIHQKRLDFYTSNGIDDVELFISANLGESVKPLSNVASGGELSRIMLAVKSVLAGREDTPTLIFDEIDSGISGITAGKVAEKLQAISMDRQVICITHLPQIAAYADFHFLVKKYSEENQTRTEIFCLDKKDSVLELARILGGANITDKILESALEMKEMAKRKNQNL